MGTLSVLDPDGVTTRLTARIPLLTWRPLNDSRNSDCACCVLSPLRPHAASAIAASAAANSAYAICLILVPDIVGTRI
jgi:hypothetical protein